MSFKGNAVPTSYKRGLLQAKHDFDNHTFKIALYDVTASLAATTANYTTEGEIADAGAYTAGGVTLVNNGTAQGNERAWADFADVSIAGALSARGALIYNTTTSGGSGTTDAVRVLDFGSTKTSTTLFQIKFPSADSLNAIVLIK